MEQPTASGYANLSLQEPTPKSATLPAFVLFLISPLIAEVLLGATRLTKIGGLILVSPFYGCGVLLIRELVRRCTTSWRWLGVNFVLTQWELGYHIVWSICIPILTTELLFPARRTQPWLGPLGVSVCAIVFVRHPCISSSPRAWLVPSRFLR